MICAPYGIKKVTSQDKMVVIKDLLVIAPKGPGKAQYVVHARSADYFGLDVMEVSGSPCLGMCLLARLGL